MRKIIASVAIVAVLAVAGMVEAGGYTLTDLGSGGAYGINSKGQIVGSNANGYAVIFSNGTATDLGWYNNTLGTGTNFIKTTMTINNFGQVVGTSYDSGNKYAMLYDNGTVTNLSANLGNNSYATSINDSGQVVGMVNRMGTLFSNGTVTSLGTLGGTGSKANGITNSGQIVGSSGTSIDNNYAQHAALFSNGTVTDLGALSGTHSSAYSINNAGQAVGYSTISGEINHHAALYSNGTVTDLGTLGGSDSVANIINNKGQIVGNFTTADGTTHAALWSNGTAIDLNSLVNAANGWVLISANDINDSGQIVGNGIFNGQMEAFLLTPTPIPAAAWLMGSGLMGLFGFRRKKT